MATFFRDEDYERYLGLLAHFSRELCVDIWAYCLMPNHVHLLAVPDESSGLAKLASEVHRRYTLAVNGREGWKGHLWQGRFFSVPLSETHIYMAARYIELNPARAGLVKDPADWRWSSAGAHLSGKSDGVVQVAPLLQRFGDWRAFLGTDVDEEALELIRLHERTGRPLGDVAFIEDLERRVGRSLRPGRPGPKSSTND